MEKDCSNCKNSGTELCQTCMHTNWENDGTYPDFEEVEDKCQEK
jgi:hypothetical protein